MRSSRGCVLLCCRRIAKLRGSGQLLHTDEWKAYTEVGGSRVLCLVIVAVGFE
jgi:hypothetical protein